MSVARSNRTLFKVVRELQTKSQELGMNIALGGGLAVHILRASVGNEPNDWKHKDIDVVLPLTQISSFIGLLKTFGYAKSPLSPKDKNRYTYQNLICGKKVSINIVGLSSLITVEVEYAGHPYRILSPRAQLKYMEAKWVALNKNPKVERSVKFLKNYVSPISPKEVELKQKKRA